MDGDLSIFVNYGIAGLILYVFYRLTVVEMRSLRETIAQLKDTIAQLKETVAMNTKVLEMLMDEVRKNRDKSD